MTFNIRHGRGLDGKVHLQRLADLIKQHNIQIIGLNEVDQRFSRRSNYEDQSKWLAEALQMDFRFGPSLSINGRKYGNTILSALPITSHQNHLFRLQLPIAEPRSILETTIQVEDKQILVLASHFSILPLLQQKQVSFCENYHTTYPTILMGDLNRQPTSSSYQKLTKKYRDCSFEKPSPTYPANKPRSRIDYVFVSTHFEVIEANIIRTDVSDHLPVKAKVKLK